MDPYANLANQYGQEQEFGTRLYDSLNQRMADQPNQLLDRFMRSYQMQLQQKRQAMEDARRQQHEDTYLQMAQTAREREDDAAKAKFAEWVSKNYKEGRDDGVAELMGRAAGFDPGQIKSMLPKGSYGPTGGGETIGTVGGRRSPGIAESVPGMENAPIPGAGAELAGGTPITMPETPGAYSPGMGQGVAKSEADLAIKQTAESRKAQHDAWKREIEQTKANIARALQESKSGVDKARIDKLTAEADALNIRIDSGEFDMKPDVMRAQINRLNALTANTGATRGTDPTLQEERISRIANAEVPKDIMGNRDPSALNAARERVRAKLGLTKPKTIAPTSAPPVSKLKEGVNTRFANGEIWTLKNGVATKVS